MGVRTENPAADRPDEKRYDNEAQKDCDSEKDQLAANPGLDVKQAANAG